MDKVYKKVEVVGISAASFSEAVQSAIRRAAETIEHISWFEVVEHRGSVADGKVTEYQVTLKVGFRVGAGS